MSVWLTKLELTITSAFNSCANDLKNERNIAIFFDSPISASICFFIERILPSAGEKNNFLLQIFSLLGSLKK